MQTTTRDLGTFLGELAGAALELIAMDHGDSEVLHMLVRGGMHDGALLSSGNGFCASIAPVMTGVRAHEGSAEEASRLLGNFPGYRPYRGGLMVIESGQSMWHIWAYSYNLYSADIVASKPQVFMPILEETSQRPLWVGGPSLAELWPAT